MDQKKVNNILFSQTYLANVRKSSNPNLENRRLNSELCETSWETKYQQIRVRPRCLPSQTAGTRVRSLRRSQESACVQQNWMHDRPGRDEKQKLVRKLGPWLIQRWDALASWLPVEARSLAPLSTPWDLDLATEDTVWGPTKVTWTAAVVQQLARIVWWARIERAPKACGGRAKSVAWRGQKRASRRTDCTRTGLADENPRTTTPPTHPFSTRRDLSVVSTPKGFAASRSNLHAVSLGADHPRGCASVSACARVHLSPVLKPTKERDFLELAPRPVLAVR